MKLTDRALLVQLAISQWTARKFDRRTTEAVAQANNVSDVVGRYNKALLPLNNTLARIHKHTAAIRQEFYKNTLPWGLEGSRILPTENYLSFMQEFRNHKYKWQTLVDEFCDNYGSAKAQAQQVLGTLYDPNDYPDEHAIRNKFSLDMAVFPVPTNDFRVELSDGELASIQQDIEARVQSASQQAMRDVWERLYEKVTHISNKLSDPSAIFRDSMVENARELCALLPKLNFADDPDLEAMRVDVERKLVSHHPDALRNDPILRADTAKEASAMARKMEIFMQGVQ
jgi:hypothetical protein